MVIRIGRPTSHQHDHIRTRRSAGRCRVEGLDIGTSARQAQLFGTMWLYPTLD
jgi:hypothetical protein